MELGNEFKAIIGCIIILRQIKKEGKPRKTAGRYLSHCGGPSAHFGGIGEY